MPETSKVDFESRPEQQTDPVHVGDSVRPRYTYGRRLRIAALFEEDADKYLDTVITVCGWAKTVRPAEKGKLCFIELYDGSIFGHLQIVIDDTVEGFAQAVETGVGSSYKCVGKLIESPKEG